MKTIRHICLNHLKAYTSQEQLLFKGNKVWSGSESRCQSKSKYGRAAIIALTSIRSPSALNKLRESIMKQPTNEKSITTYVVSSICNISIVSTT